MAGFALLRACLLSIKRCCYFGSVPVVRGKGPTTPSEQNVFYCNARRRLMFRRRPAHQIQERNLSLLVSLMQTLDVYCCGLNCKVHVPQAEFIEVSGAQNHVLPSASVICRGPPFEYCTTLIRIQCLRAVQVGLDVDRRRRPLANRTSALSNFPTNDEETNYTRAPHGVTAGAATDSVPMPLRNILKWQWHGFAIASLDYYCLPQLSTVTCPKR